MKRDFQREKGIKFFPTNKKGEGNYTPLLNVLLITFIIALVINLILGSFDIDTSVPNPEGDLSGNSFYFSLVDKLNSADSFFGSGIIGFIVEQINVWTYIPSEISVPFFIIFIFALVWTTVKLFLP